MFYDSRKDFWPVQFTGIAALNPGGPMVRGWGRRSRDGPRSGLLFLLLLFRLGELTVCGWVHRCRDSNLAII